MVPVVVRRLSADKVDWDLDFKVPRGSLVYGLPEMVKALVRWDVIRDAPSVTGTVVVRSGSFAVPIGEDPGFKPGDKIEAIGGVKIDPPVYVTGVRPTARVGGRYRLIRYTFESRPEGV